MEVVEVEAMVAFTAALAALVRMEAVMVTAAEAVAFAAASVMAVAMAMTLAATRGRF